jgi:hypothetical protein
MRRVLAASAIVAVVAGVAAVWAVAQSDEGPPSLTGCLSANGNLEDFALGSSPAKACKQSATQVQLSGGDITSVVAGDGLEGGALSGAATLAVAERFRLPEGCANGDTPSWGDGRWTCAARSRVTNHTVFRRVPFVVSAVSPAAPQTVETLHLPAGDYVVATHVLASIVGDVSSFSHLRCSTSPSIGAPASGLVLTDLNIGNTNGTTGAGTLSGTSPMTVADGATIQLSCRSLVAFGTRPTVNWAVITATPIDDFVLEEDTSTG